jgi:hypothetical protein
MQRYRKFIENNFEKGVPISKKFSHIIVTLKYYIFIVEYIIMEKRHSFIAAP